ncbi:MAG TPA: glycosyltransferase [Verrucomicrobiae bacterium]|nr:glycosyltransferase [Verrucomicrobiae bacterium]
MKLLIIGNRGGTHIGQRLQSAATAFGHNAALLDSAAAMAGSRWLRRLNWRLRDHRPTRLDRFSDVVVETARAFQPGLVLATGIAPLTHAALGDLAAHGITTANYLTDDPWNPAHRARWFLHALPFYSTVFSPRRANLGDLAHAGCPAVHYLPFAYDPALHYRQSPSPANAGFASDVLFIGAADPDRLPYTRALISAGLDLLLFGHGWQCDPLTRRCHCGYADVPTARRATAAAKISLCLVRRANRDGHTMRTFEAAAMGACLLAEDTPEHREILGDRGDTAVFFRSIPEMVQRADWLLRHPDERRSLSAAVQARLTPPGNTYADRLQSILQLCGLDPDAFGNHPPRVAACTRLQLQP